MGEILLGTSGWHYKEWVGPFYRDEKESKLMTYSKVFNTAEIDSTFYRYPDKGTVMGWLRYTKPDFVFTAKLPQLITHEKKLYLKEGVGEDLERFCNLMKPLLSNGKLGCILIQLPPKFISEQLDVLESFFEILPPEFQFAVEFRDLSWMRDDTWKLLEKHRIAYTIVDEPLLPPEIKVTSKIAYFRWHGKGRSPWYDYRYKVEELLPWIPKVKEAAKKTEKIYGYFNNHYHGYAVENCLEVLEMLSPLTQEQAKAKIRVKGYLTPIEEKIVKFETFLSPERRTVQDLLPRFIDRGRLRRAENIGDKELKIEEVTNTRITASIREYYIVIDLENRTILHDCPDWLKDMSDKRFCKHVGKLMLALPETKSTEILGKIDSQRENWKFESITE